jgi:hypothetical protein
VPTFADRGCHVVSVTDPYDCNLGFLDWSRWTPLQTHYFSENLVVPIIELGTSGSVPRNSGHQTTEEVHEGEIKGLKVTWPIIKIGQFLKFTCE